MRSRASFPTLPFLLLALVIGGCGAAAASGETHAWAGAVAPGSAPPAATGPATFVVTLEADVAAPVLRGPFVVTSINPGTTLELGLVSAESCAQVTAWFDYSGGGVAVAAGQVLCVRSSHYGPETHGFSGFARGDVVATPAAPAGAR